MLSKSDIKTIKDLLKGFATKDDLKNFATKDDLKNFATKDDLKNFATKDDLKGLAQQRDLLEVKDKLDELYDFSQVALGNLLSWTDDIHNTIVKEKLPERVKKLEQVIKSS